MDKVTKKGSMYLFLYAKHMLAEKLFVLLQSQYPENYMPKKPDKIKNYQVGEMFGITDNSAISNLRRGRRRLTNIENFISVSKHLQIPVDYLFRIASEQEIPECVQQYSFAVEKSQLTDKGA